MKRIKEDEFTKMVHKKVNDEMKRSINYWSVYWTIRAMFKCLEDIIEDGNSLYIKEYFTMYPRLKKSRRVWNFGNPCIASEHYKTYFKPHKKLADACKRLKESERLETESEDNKD